MNKLYYFIVVTIRIFGRYLSRISGILKKLVYYMTARTHAGIMARLWMAAGMSVAALLFDVFYLQDEFQRLPAYVPLLFDLNGNIAEWGHKSMLDGFTELRAAFFVIMALIGWLVYVVKGRTLKAERIGLLIVDIANLVVTTGVAMAAVYIEIAKGNHNEKLAEEWEYAVMCFWLLTLVIEFIADRKYLNENKQ